MPELLIPRNLSPEQEHALKVLAQWLSSQSNGLVASSSLEADWQKWLTTLFGPWVSDATGRPIPFASHQGQLWDWVWSIRRGQKPPPFIAIWPRGGAKSTSAEMAAVALGAMGRRRYCLYISATQEQADDHIQNIGALLESPLFAQYYPAAAQRLLGKYGSSKGWRRNRLRTSNGFTADAIGLDTAARGVKLEEIRPDLLILDDLDEELDGPPATEKKITVLTRKLLPAGSSDSAVLAIQNLVIPDGIFSRLAGIDGSTRADFLQNRIVSGPFPAIADPEILVHPTTNRIHLVGGKALWEGQNLQKCQQQIDEWGYSSWLVEAQQEVDIPLGGLFANIDFDRIHVQLSDVPELVRVVVWVDPAVTSTDKSDSHGIQVDGLGVDDKVYRLWSKEKRMSPDSALRLAILKALEFKADHVGVETDQGGDLWQAAYNSVWQSMVNSGEVNLSVVPYAPMFRSEKAGAGYGPKSHRASQMLVDYEHDVFRHVLNAESTHHSLERALRRFPLRKPYDLVDAAFWGWNDLVKGLGGIGASDDAPTSLFAMRSSSLLARSLHGQTEKAVEVAYSPESDRMRVGRFWQGHGRGTLWRHSSLADAQHTEEMAERSIDQTDRPGLGQGQ